MFTRSPWPALACGLLAACNFVVAPSNEVPRPDGGSATACLAPTADGGVLGTGVVAGPVAFTVASASEQLEIPTLADGGTSVLSFTLGSGTTCPSRIIYPGAVLIGNFFNPGPGSFALGRYPILSTDTYPSAPVVAPPGVDGGYASLTLEEYTLPDGGRVPDGGFSGIASAFSGIVNLTSLAACSLSGTFSASFSPDGGAVMTGSFGATYCP